MTSWLAWAGDAGRELEFVPLADGVWLHTSWREIPGYGPFPANGLVVVHGGSATLIDTPWPEADTPRLDAWLRERGIRLKYALVTHSHADSTAGLAWLNAAGVATYASRRTNELLASRGEAQAGAVFEDGLPAELAGIVEMHFPGPGHTEDNHVAWLPGPGILFGGCLVKSLESAGLGNVADARIEAWAGTVAGLERRYPAVRVVVPGHGAPGDAGLLAHTARLVEAHRDTGRD